MEGDADADRLIVLSQNLSPKQPSHECGDSLLTVDENALTCGRRTVLKLHGGVSPRYEIADGVTLIERVEQIADFGGLPHKGALDFRDGDLARFHPGEQGLDGMRRDGIALSGH